MRGADEWERRWRDNHAASLEWKSINRTNHGFWCSAGRQPQWKLSSGGESNTATGTITKAYLSNIIVANNCQSVAASVPVKVNDFEMLLLANGKCLCTMVEPLNKTYARMLRAVWEKPQQSLQINNTIFITSKWVSVLSLAHLDLFLPADLLKAINRSINKSSNVSIGPNFVAIVELATAPFYHTSTTSNLASNPFCVQLQALERYCGPRNRFEASRSGVATAIVDMISCSFVNGLLRNHSRRPTPAGTPLFAFGLDSAQIILTCIQL